MSGGVDIEFVSLAMRRLLECGGRPVVVEDGESGEVLVLPPSSAAAVDGGLPVFLAAGEAIWREASGCGFGLKLDRDAGALFGYRVDRLGEAPVSSVILSLMEAAAQALRPAGIVMNELRLVWEGASDRAAAMVSENARRPRPGGRAP